MSERPRRIFLVAAEESGDRLGAALIAALREQLGPRTTFSGVGGHAMANEGVPSLFPTDDLAIIGFSAIPARLPMILRRIRETAAAALEARPDVVVIIDSPDFTHRVAKAIRAASPGIPIVDYVSPSVWAWRPWRAKAMRRYVDHVLALLPFEPDAHRRLGGPPCTYVGHPLATEIGTLRPDADEQARRDGDPPLLLVLPGSRRGEIRRLAEPFGAALGLLRDEIGAFELVLPTTPRLAEAVAAAVESWPVTPRIVTDHDGKRQAFRQARAALAKSGTVTLELALAGVPMVTAYKVSAIEHPVARILIRLPTVILANLVLGENAVPEFLQADCTPEKLAAALAPLVADTPARRRQVEAFARLDAIMEIGGRPPADRAADVVASVMEAGRAPSSPSPGGGGSAR